MNNRKRMKRLPKSDHVHKHIDEALSIGVPIT